MIHTLGTEFVHFYLLEEDGQATLIDAGLPGYRTTLEPSLAQAGLSLDDVKAIVLTHADPDHVGFAGELARSHGIPVYIHRADAERARLGKTKQAEGSALSMVGALRHGQSRRMLRHMMSNGGASQAKVPEVVAFGDGDVLDVPGRLQAVHTPGHTDGHCVLRAPSQDALFIGDAVNNVEITDGRPGGFLAPPAATVSVAQAVESLARIEQLEAGTLYFGHGDPSTAGTAQVVAEARAHR